MAYMVGTEGDCEHVGVVNQRQRYTEHTLMYTDSRVGYDSRLKGALQDIDLSLPYFSGKENGNDRLWRLLDCTTRNEMQRRVVLAAEWIGKGVNDPDTAKAFVQFVFAIEVLLSTNTKGLISPSIMSQISEAAAMLLARDFEARCKMERLVKKLYHLRSRVVHQGKSQVAASELSDALRVAKGLTRLFLTDPVMNSLEKTDELSRQLKKMKYGANDAES